MGRANVTRRIGGDLKCGLIRSIQWVPERGKGEGETPFPVESPLVTVAPSHTSGRGPTPLGCINRMYVPNNSIKLDPVKLNQEAEPDGLVWLRVSHGRRSTCFTCRHMGGPDWIFDEFRCSTNAFVFSLVSRCKAPERPGSTERMSIASFVGGLSTDRGRIFLN